MMISPLQPGSAAPSSAGADAATVQVPVSDRWTRYEALVRLEAWDACSDEAHAFLAYREVNLADGAWRVRVVSALTAGALLEPAVMAQQAQAAAACGATGFVWGYRQLPRAGDPRHIEFRLHVEDGELARLELYARLRRPDGSPAGPCSATCRWPGAGGRGGAE